VPAPELGEGSRYMHEPPNIRGPSPFYLWSPSKYALILYLNGSDQEGIPDSCDTSRPGINIPETATDLAGMEVAGYELLVFAFCTPTTVGGFNQPDGDGVTKVWRRAEELESLLAHIQRYDIPPERIFVMGQSAGAWAGLLVQRWGNTPFAGLIGFAPAFAGLHGRRLDVWQVERDRQADLIAEAPRIEALIYGFEQDPYEPARAMGWLAEMPGVRYVELSGRHVLGIDCENRFPHSTVFKDCFGEFRQRQILDYIEERITSGVLG